MVAPIVRQNAYLNRDRQLAPFHGPADTISGTDPVEIKIDQVARDIILENVSTATNLHFTFVDPDSHGLNNFWKRLKPGQVFSSYCNFRHLWLKGDGASYEVLYNAEGQMSFGVVDAVFDPEAALGSPLNLTTAEGAVTDNTGVTQDLITQIVPSGKKWEVRAAKVVCRAYGKFQVYVDGAEIGRGVTSPIEANVRFDEWEPFDGPLLEGQEIKMTFKQVTGPVVDIFGFIGVTEKNI